MHLVAYRQRPDIGAVVHAHPPTATGFAVAGIPLDRAVLAEVVTTLGSIPIAEYETPSTRELADTVGSLLKAHDGVLLANHGAIALGKDLFSAYYKMETIEHFATISLVARQLGREHLLSRGEVERLQELRGTYGIAAPAPICPDPGAGRRGRPVLPGHRRARVGRGAARGGHAAWAAAPLTVGTDGEIRLTYAQLTELIDEAVRQLAHQGGRLGASKLRTSTCRE